jgi:hypothetical protein
MSGEPSPGHVAGSHRTFLPELIHVGVAKLYADDPAARGAHLQEASPDVTGHYQACRALNAPARRSMISAVIASWRTRRKAASKASGSRATARTRITLRAGLPVGRSAGQIA